MTDAATLAAKVLVASQLAACGRVYYAASTVQPILPSRSDGWRFLVGLFSVMRPTVDGYRDLHGEVPAIQFAASQSAGAVALAQVANPFFRGDRLTAAARWEVVFDSGLGPDVLSVAVVGAGACLVDRYATPPTP